MKERLDPSVFRLPAERIREGYYSDAYFNFTKELLEERGECPVVTMQVFQKEHSICGGIDEAIAILKLCSGRHRDGGWEDGWDDLVVHALYEGDEIEPFETVMTIEGPYDLFAHLETVYLGPLARRSLIMRNVRNVVAAPPPPPCISPTARNVGAPATEKPILFMPARHDHWLVQTGDGWSAHVAGAVGGAPPAPGGRGGGPRPGAPA